MNARKIFEVPEVYINDEASMTGCRSISVGRQTGDQLIAEMLVQEIGHEVVGFLGFRQCGIIPEGVRQRFEDNQLRIDTGAEISAVQDSGPAQQ